MADQTQCISRELRQIAQQRTTYRQQPEIFLFFDYVARLERQNLLFLSDKKTDECVVFIPPANGGTVAALALLIAVARGINCFVRVPRRGFSNELQVLFAIFDEVSQIGNKINQDSTDNCHAVCVQNKRKISKVVAWGSDKTRPKIEILAHSLESELIYFGTQIGISILDVDRFFDFDGKKRQRLREAFLSDLLTFDQNGCTNTRALLVKSVNRKKFERFTNEIIEESAISSKKAAVSPQARLARVFSLAGLNNRGLKKFRFSLTERVGFLEITEFYDELNSDLEKLTSGILPFIFFRSGEELKELLTKIHPKGRVAYLKVRDRNWIDDQLEEIASITEAEDKRLTLCQIGRSNDLDYNWGGVNLLRLFSN